MTLEKLKMFIWVAMNKSAEVSGDFAEGMVTAYDGVLNLLADVKDDDMVKWHPYPQKKPTGDVDYLITRKECWHNGIREITEPVVEIAFFNSINDSFEDVEDMDVIAWAEMPKPYGE